jgi:uncharacterized protein (TIGR04255 family)
MKIESVDRDKLRKQFKKHLLESVIVRLDFADILSAENLSSEIVSSIGCEFSERRVETGRNYKISDDGIFFDGEAKSWVLMDPKTKNYVKISNTFIVVEYKQYTSFEEFISIFEKVFSIYNSLFKDNELKRIGLRKVNGYIENESEKIISFEEYFNSFLVSHLTSEIFETPDDLEGDRHTLSTKNKDYKITLNYGTSRGLSQKENARKFFLDIDCFAKENIKSKNLLEHLDKMNDCLFDVFYWSIKDKMIRKLSK